MAHWAEVNENNIVTRVIVTDNNSKNEGYDWIMEAFGGTWVKTSINKTIRKNFASIGDTYDPELDAFISPKPFDSWALDENAQWQPPTPSPAAGLHKWNESTLSWVERTGA